VAISGFPIKRTQIGIASANDPWFKRQVSYTQVTDQGGGTIRFTTSTAHGFVATDTVDILSANKTTYAFADITVSNVPSTTEFDVVATFVSDDTGTVSADSDIEFLDWDDDTPDNTLREIHVQFDTDIAVGVEITLDGGSTYMPINNATTLVGLATFTMFVIDTTLLNFRSAIGSSDVVFTITVTAA